MRKFPPLTREEEHATAVRARAGDVAARHRLVRHNLALVLAVVRTLRRGGVRLDDLVQEGNLGLLRAVEKFDPKAGTRFSTYAVWWIRAFTWKHLKQARSAVRPRAGDVAQADFSLDSAVQEDSDLTHLELLEDERPGPEATLLGNEGDADLLAALSKVRGRVGEVGWDIIHNRLRRDPPHTLAEIGRRWGLSRERVRQIETATKQFLRRYLAALETTADLREAA